MDIYDMDPHEALRLTTHRYTEQLRVLHSVVKAGASPSVSHMECLEKYRQLEEMARERVTEAVEADMEACGLALDKLDQIEMPLDGAV